MKRVLLSGLFVFSVLQLKTQDDSLRFMFYNLLRFPVNTSSCNALNRGDTLKKIVQYVQPDILGVCELTSTNGGDMVLNQALNVNGITHYQKGPYLASSTSLHEAIFYNANKLELVNSGLIPALPRAFQRYLFYVIDPDLYIHNDTIFIEFFLCHLEPGNDAAARSVRETAIRELKNYLDVNPPVGNRIIAGDMNVYTASEPGYALLLDSTVFDDPINEGGSWNNNGAYAHVHTQSTRALNDSPTPDCNGSEGGLDDRFDQVLTSPAVLSGVDHIRYISGSYHALANDGAHFNSSINTLPNNSGVPIDVVNALYYMSDHLPVILDLEVYYPTIAGSPTPTLARNWKFYTTNPVKEELRFVFSSSFPQQIQLALISLRGETIMQKEIEHSGGEEVYTFSTEGISAGVYLIRMVDTKGAYLSKKIMVK